MLRQQHTVCPFGSILLLVWMIASFALVVFSVILKEQIEHKLMKFRSLPRPWKLHDLSIQIVIYLQEDSAGYEEQVKKKRNNVPAAEL